MHKDRLYLLKPDFVLDGSKVFCAECAMVEGMLSFYNWPVRGRGTRWPPA